MLHISCFQNPVMLTPIMGYKGTQELLQMGKGRFDAYGREDKIRDTMIDEEMFEKYRDERHKPPEKFANFVQMPDLVSVALLDPYSSLKES